MVERYREIPIQKASNEQLLQFLLKKLHIDVDAKADRSTLLSLIRQAHDKDTIEVIETPAGLETPVLGARRRGRAEYSSGREDPMVTIQIHRSENDTQNYPIPVSVNGTTILVPRGQKVKIPYRYYEALRNACQVQTVVDKDNRIIEVNEVPVYPMQVYEFPPAEEIERFLEESKDLSA